MTASQTRTGSARRWAIAFVFAVLVGIAAGIWGGVQYLRAEQLASSLSGSKGQIEQLQDQVGQLQQQAQEAVVQLGLARQPLLPVTVTFRGNPGGAGVVADFRSTAPSQLEVIVSITDQATQRQKRFELALLPLQPHASPSGWTFQAGQEMELTSEGFRPLEIAVPTQ